MQFIRSMCMRRMQVLMIRQYTNAFTLRIDGRSIFALPAIDLEPDTYRVEIRKLNTAGIVR